MVGYGAFFLVFFSGQKSSDFCLNESIQCAAVNMYLRLIIVPPHSVPQFISSRITCQGISPSSAGTPLTTTVLLLKHRSQNSKQINIAKYISKFLIYGAKMSDKCVKSQKKIFVHCPFLQSQAK